MTYDEIFTACFPGLGTSPAAFEKMADRKNCQALEHWEAGNLLGYALLKGDRLRLLCVKPDCQGRGIGGELLRWAEKMIEENGGQEITVGGTDSRLIQGAPDQAAAFFAKRGYVLGKAYEEMRGDLRRFSAADFSLPAPENVEFGWYRGNLDALHRAVAAVDEEWVQYFGADSPVFCATVNGEIASFCNAEVWENCLLSTGENKVGAPGCVGTVPAFRRRGIGLKMVALACEELKAQGCDTCFIHYTGVGPWYAKLGIRTVLKWHFCKKTLG